LTVQVESAIPVLGGHVVPENFAFVPVVFLDNGVTEPDLVATQFRVVLVNLTTRKGQLAVLVSCTLVVGGSVVGMGGALVIICEEDQHKKGIRPKKGRGVIGIGPNEVQAAPRGQEGAIPSVCISKTRIWMQNAW